MIDRLIVVVGALFGLLGVAASAAAAHVTGGGNLGTAANFLLFHAPVLLTGVALVQAGLLRRSVALLGLVLIAFGGILFCGDLSLRALKGVALFSSAAPTGGILLMLGWLGLVVAALLPKRV